MSGFVKFPPPPPLTHRQQWAALLTAGAAVITAPALWGAHGFARHFFVILGLAIVLVGALGFIRDWHMPFVRNRADDPGIVDRKRIKERAIADKKMAERQAAAALAEVEEQLKVAQIKRHGEKMKEKFWESQHGLLSRGRDVFALEFFVWAEPPIFTDYSMLYDYAGSCVIQRGNEKFQSAMIECYPPRGYVLVFPGDFTPKPEKIEGRYEVEWSLPDNRLVSRDRFTLDENGKPS